MPTEKVCRQIPWQAFDEAAVDPTLLALVKAAALVEGNSADYVHYLHKAFCENSQEKALIDAWGKDEALHGKLLGQWAMKADRGWDYAKALARFQKLYHIPVDAEQSVRGSRTGEMVARCIVEVGTSSFYMALHEQTQEPVLKYIARAIARDEFSHYGLFYHILQKLEAREHSTKLQRARVIYQRIKESGDDELACAYYSANAQVDAPYDMRLYAGLYLSKALSLYQPMQIKRVVRMVGNLLGISLHGFIEKMITGVAFQFLQFQCRRHVRIAQRLS